MIASQPLSSKWLGTENVVSIFIQQWFLIWHLSKWLILVTAINGPKSQWLNTIQISFLPTWSQTKAGQHSSSWTSRICVPSTMWSSRSRALFFQTHKWKWERILGEGEPDTRSFSPEVEYVTSDHIALSRTSQMANLIPKEARKWRCNT